MVVQNALKSALALILAISLAGVAAAQSSEQSNQDERSSSTENIQVKNDDDLEKQFNKFSQQVEREFTEFERAVKAAYDEVERAVTPVWGKTETKLPQAKVWTGYSQNLKSRVIVDYQKGTVAVETVEKKITKPQPQDQQQQTQKLRNKLDDMLDADTKKLDQQDILAKATRKKLAESKIDPANLPALPKSRKQVKRELGDLIDTRKKPVVSEREIVTPTGEKKVIKRIEMPMAPNYVRKGAARYQTAILSNADRNKIERSLVLSIMKNESAFNPRARSHVPAYGLMQLVPTSGGGRTRCRNICAVRAKIFQENAAITGLFVSTVKKY